MANSNLFPIFLPASSHFSQFTELPAKVFAGKKMCGKSSVNEIYLKSDLQSPNCWTP